MSYDSPRFQLPTMTPAIKLLLLANAAVFVLNIVLGGVLSAPPSMWEGSGFWFAFSWPGLWEGFGLGLVRIVTYQFAHSFESVMHLLMNMLVLYFFGTMAEARLGYRGTFKLYLVGGAAGALLHLVLATIQGHSDVPLVGASGACYSFLVYAACMAPRSMVIFIVFPIQLWILAAGLVAIGLYSTYIEFVRDYVGGVAHGAHLGGAALGYAAHRWNWFVDWGGQGSFGSPGVVAGFLQRMRQRKAEQKHKHAHDQQLQLDEILAKVKQHGLASLSTAERRFLERMSKQAQKGD